MFQHLCLRFIFWIAIGIFLKIVLPYSFRRANSTLEVAISLSTVVHRFVVLAVLLLAAKSAACVFLLLGLLVLAARLLCVDCCGSCCSSSCC
ncbi:conserved hypothetical protein [Ricinus communis]|uniref:Uncharacterized protein n=1 Tax=Ricinus communis TaxID=3988 RepID=B9RK39_RICCO|nr:conserved hypothetical protein [Ricinus communis]